MARDVAKELKSLKKQFADAKNEQIRLETRLEEAKKRRKEANDQIKEEGYDVKTLPSVIQEKEKTLADSIEEIKSYLPEEEDNEEDWDD
jgi:predicted  nucleic acid-binding Zn-ribbon protein